MERITVPRIFLSGVSRGVGKSLIGLGLAFALRKKNLSVSCCVNGPNLPQAVLYHRISRRYVRTLDSRLLTSSQILDGVQQAGVGADVVLIEGRDGLFDGESPGILKGSDAELAGLLSTPVVLIVDTRMIGSSIVALIKGFRDCSNGFDISGVIGNRLDPREDAEAHDAVYYDTALQTSGMSPLLGSIPELEYEIPIPRGVVSDRPSAPSLPMQFYVDIGNLVSNRVDIERLLQIAESAPQIKLSGGTTQPSNRRCRIAVSDDSCFNLCFQDNLDLLRFHGAEIVPFSPLADVGLPKKVGAIYLTSGDLVEYGAELSQNEDLKQSIREFAKQGGVVYSEGSGTAFLCDSYRIRPGESLAGVGLLKGSAELSSSSFSYSESALVEESILGRAGIVIKGISRNDWKFSMDARMLRTVRVGHGSRAPENEGYSAGAQMLSTLCMNHFGSNPVVAKNIVDAAEVVQKI